MNQKEIIRRINTATRQIGGATLTRVWSATRSMPFLWGGITSMLPYSLYYYVGGAKQTEPRKLVFEITRDDTPLYLLLLDLNTGNCRAATKAEREAFNKTKG